MSTNAACSNTLVYVIFSSFFIVYALETWLKLLKKWHWKSSHILGGGFFTNDASQSASKSKPASRMQFLYPATVRQVLEAPEEGIKLGENTTSMVKSNGGFEYCSALEKSTPKLLSTNHNAWLRAVTECSSSEQSCIWIRHN